MSTKRFSFTKGIVALVLTLVAILGLVACETPAANPDKEAVEAALDQVALVYGQGDSASSVTRNLTLPSALGEITISWATNNAAVVSNQGVVVRPNADTVVTLTATLTLREVSETKVFQITVKAAEAAATPEEALAALQIFSSTLQFNTATNRYTTTTDLFLPTRSMKLDIVWTSPNPAVINTAGKVVRPAWGQSDQTVILVASVGDATREFIITVKAIDVKPTNIVLSDAYDALLLAGGISGNVVTSDINLPNTVGTDGATVTWESSNDLIITNDGSVYRPVFGSPNAEVTLTATISYKNVTLEKQFDVVVPARVKAVEFSGDIDTMLSKGDGKYVLVEGVTVIALVQDGFYIADETGEAYVYTLAAPSSKLKVGNVYDIETYVDVYFSAYQFSGNTNEPVIFVPSSAAATTVEYVEKTVEAINAYAKPTDLLPLKTELIKVTGIVYVDPEARADYNTFIIPVGATGLVKDGSGNITNALMIYYKSNKAAITALSGQKIQINLILHAYRTNDKVWAVNFAGKAADIVILEMTDLESVNAAKAQSLASIPAIQETATTLTLPTNLFGTTIVWTSSDNSIINATTGVVTLVEGAQPSVTLTATITKGSVTEVATKVVKVGPIPLSTVEQVVNAAVNSTQYRVQGTVTASEYYRTYFIQQGNAGIAIYTSDTTMLALLKANVGKDVEVIGTRSVFSGMRQMTPVSIKALGTTGTITPVNADAVALNATDMLPYQGRLVTLTQLKVTNRTTDSNNNVTLTLTQVATGRTILMKWDSRVVLSTAASTLLGTLTVGKEISVTNVLAWLNNPYFYFTDSTIVTEVAITDAFKLAGDKAALSLPAEVKTSQTLTLPATGANGSAIVWATDNASIISAAGAVSLPVTGQVTVKLTATLTLGSLTETREFNIVVGLSDQDLVDADAAALVVAAAHTSATTITLPATGANGSAIVWTSSDNALINPSTGAVVMPSNGQVVVTLTATLSLNAATKVVTFDVTVGTNTQPVVYSSDLFISYYMEGSVGNRKVIAVYNNTGATVDLTQYKIGSLNNLTAAPVAANIAGPTLTGTLEHGKVLVIYHGDMVNASNSAYIADFATAVAGLTDGNRSVAFSYAFNGTQGDIIAIAKNVNSTWTFVDMLGVWTSAIPSGTSAQWETDYTKDHTLVRKSTVLNPVTTTDWNEWEVLASNVYDVRMLTWK